MGGSDREVCPTPERPCHFNEVEWGKLLAGMSGVKESLIEVKVALREQKDEIKRELAKQIGGVTAELSKQNSRIAKVEKWQWKTAGALGVLAAAIPLILKALGLI